MWEPLSSAAMSVPQFETANPRSGVSGRTSGSHIFSRRDAATRHEKLLFHHSNSYENDGPRPSLLLSSRRPVCVHEIQYNSHLGKRVAAPARKVGICDVVRGEGVVRC